ncbi:hypothetical protein J6590_045255 [Homalodisca vitripennis]|nr:hypothetical protein J6590_045255 [Homalodisca vitripennis]
MKRVLFAFLNSNRRRERHRAATVRAPKVKGLLGAPKVKGLLGAPKVKGLLGASKAKVQGIKSATSATIDLNLARNRSVAANTIASCADL